MDLSERDRAEWIVDRLGEPPGTAEARTDPKTAALRQEAESLRALWEGLAQVDAPVAAETPSEGIVDEFHRRLRTRILKPVPPRRSAMPWIAAAAAIAIVVLATWQVARHSQRTPGATVPASAATWDRLEELARPAAGTSQSHEIESLAEVLAREPNPSLRLMALDVLAERYGRAGLEGRLGPALAHERDPMVRATMVRAIGELGLAADGPALRALSARNDLDPIARREVERALAELGS